MGAVCSCSEKKPERPNLPPLDMPLADPVDYISVFRSAGDTEESFMTRTAMSYLFPVGGFGTVLDVNGKEAFTIMEADAPASPTGSSDRSKLGDRDVYLLSKGSIIGRIRRVFQGNAEIQYAFHCSGEMVALAVFKFRCSARGLKVDPVIYCRSRYRGTSHKGVIKSYRDNGEECSLNYDFEIHVLGDLWKNTLTFHLNHPNAPPFAKTGDLPLNSVARKARFQGIRSPKFIERFELSMAAHVDTVMILAAMATVGDFLITPRLVGSSLGKSRGSDSRFTSPSHRSGAPEPLGSPKGMFEVLPRSRAAVDSKNIGKDHVLSK